LRWLTRSSSGDSGTNAAAAEPADPTARFLKATSVEDSGLDGDHFHDEVERLPSLLVSPDSAKALEVFKKALELGRKNLELGENAKHPTDFEATREGREAAGGRQTYGRGGERARDFRRQLESFVNRDDIPKDLKSGVKSYFENIHAGSREALARSPSSSQESIPAEREAK
jgi:hypothetical protein